MLYGGVLEHPAHSKAWDWFGLPKPDRDGGWTVRSGFASAYVEQGHYGHISRKATWLLTSKIDNLPALVWGPSPQKLHPIALERYGYEIARRIGMMAMVGGKDKTKIRNATPIPFRDLMLSIARKVRT